MVSQAVSATCYQTSWFYGFHHKPHENAGNLESSSLRALELIERMGVHNME